MAEAGFIMEAWGLKLNHMEFRNRIGYLRLNQASWEHLNYWWFDNPLPRCM
jgi:hypothetical protein